MASATQTATDGSVNASAKLAFLNALYELNAFGANKNMQKKDDYSPLSPEAADILDDHNVSEDDNGDVITDVVWDETRSTALSVEYSAKWSAGSEFNGDPQFFQVWLTLGGPNCYISGEFGKHDVPVPDSLEMHYSWACESKTLSLTDADKEAIGWFIEQVAV